MIKQQKNWSVVIAGPDRILGQLLTKEGNLFPIRPGEDYQLISSHNDKVIVQYMNIMDSVKSPRGENGRNPDKTNSK